MKCKIMDSAELLFINNRSARKGYNATLSSDGLDAIDPDGIHVITMTMIHEHAGGAKVEPHVRAMVLLKVKDSDVPRLGRLDMTFEWFNSLREVTVTDEQIREAATDA